MESPGKPCRRGKVCGLCQLQAVDQGSMGDGNPGHSDAANGAPYVGQRLIFAWPSRSRSDRARSSFGAEPPLCAIGRLTLPVIQADPMSTFTVFRAARYARGSRQSRVAATRRDRLD